ncbi:MAG: bifunctional demethylmenaquinone methyltransferase/2-methoxy-6-polyprenyl-1,4-benzoquinol methylase UbiE [Actinobacteria bacterium]|nr:bifunctional demethylmenaquinone methyltransferase/2-methoxy-6-polyprenyl-1,4-benzoquinol methylase UbiE [Actinomycetota bacterium]
MRDYTRKAIKSPDRVRSMFNAVAERYDLVNRLLTLGMDQRWRKLAARSTGAGKESIVLDACTGTGDLALAIYSVTGAKVIGVDFSRDMLDKAVEKANLVGADGDVTFVVASVDNLPFNENLFDAITVGFGLRNTVDYQVVLAEFNRVVRPGGRLVCLEFSEPELSILRRPYRKFLSSIVPLIGRLVSNNYPAYKYLSDSIQVFPPQKELGWIMEKAGWTDVNYRNILGGVAAIHTAIKKDG